MLNAITENRTIDLLCSDFLRSPRQQNGRHASDAEILLLGDSDPRLAVTIDGIVEEIETGIYADPYLAGWMTVMANMSDLAAVGADPIGLLLSEVLPDALDSRSVSALQRGIGDACRYCGTYVLGGDTNAGGTLLLTGCALGLVHAGRCMSRIGCAPGDLLYATGPLGGGNAFACARLILGSDFSGVPYRPVARLKQGRCMASFASACMDTSDGVLSTLDQLMRLNGTGFTLRAAWEEALAAPAKEVAVRSGIPEWLMLAGQHGEFELLCTVRPEREEALAREMEVSGMSLLLLGIVTEEPHIDIPLYGAVQSIDTALLRNLLHEHRGDVRKYFHSLLEYDAALRKGVRNHVTQ